LYRAFDAPQALVGLGIHRLPYGDLKVSSGYIYGRDDPLELTKLSVGRADEKLEFVTTDHTPGLHQRGDYRQHFLSRTMFEFNNPQLCAGGLSGRD
jgi:hypothetical protein